MLKICGICSTWRHNNSVSKDLISSNCRPDDQLMGVRLFYGVSSSNPKKISRPLEEGHWSKIKLSSRFYHALHSLSRRVVRTVIYRDAPAPVICQASRKYLWETRNSRVFTHMDCRFVDKKFRHMLDNEELLLFWHGEFQNTSRSFYKYKSVYLFCATLIGWSF